MLNGSIIVFFTLGGCPNLGIPATMAWCLKGLLMSFPHPYGHLALARTLPSIFYTASNALSEFLPHLRIGARRQSMAPKRMDPSRTCRALEAVIPRDS